MNSYEKTRKEFCSYWYDISYNTFISTQRISLHYRIISLLEEYDSNRQQYNKLLRIHSQMNECINLNSLQSYEQFDSLMD